MKKHAIIPVFIPHRGCPNDCVFCNQKAITARQADVTPEDVRSLIENYLPTLADRGLETIEVAFFGGSFTGIPIEEQSAFLEVAKEYKDRGLIHKIHMSTRPDYITAEILDNLKAYDADIIELGVQSFDPGVLEASNRGHKVEDVYKACDLIKTWGFELGIQLMIGLPGDSLEKCLYSARETVKIGPSIARLYPTIVLDDTRLHEMYKAGEYHPLTTDEAVAITKEMYRILDEAGINIIRVGLKSTDLISGSGKGNDHTAGHTYHPAFRQLVEGELAKESMEAQLHHLLDDPLENPCQNPCNVKTHSCNESFESNTHDSNGIMRVENGIMCVKNGIMRVEFASNGPSFSNMIGNSGCNRKYFQEKYPNLRIAFARDDRLPDAVYEVRLSQGKRI